MSLSSVYRRAALSVLGCVAFAVPALAQTGEIRGRVVEGDTVPVAEAAVILEGSGRVARTGPDGTFRFARIAPGAWTLRAERMGYRTASVAVTVGTVEPRSVTIMLARAGVDLGAVTVIGTRADMDESRDRLALIPGAVDLVDAVELRATRQANLSDVLRFTAGVWVQPRFGAADESQFSIRGSGLRNNFHLRGVNLLVNGMPYRNADGFTDFESLELLTAQSIEVYKGGNALRYGGSTLGGAVNLVTATGYTAPEPQVFGQGGSFGFYKAQGAWGGARGALDWYGSYAHTGLAGYRDWSEQQRDRANLHAGYALSPRTDVRGFYFFARVHEHLPGSLTAGELQADPTQAAAVNAAQQWGRDYDLHHVGLQLRSQVGAGGRLDVAPYFQYRDINHPIFQTIAQISRDYGVEARYERTAPAGPRAHRFVAGLLWASGTIDDRRYVNDTAQHQQRGALTKDQRDDAGTVAFYAEDVVGLAPGLSAVAGLRWERATRSVADAFQSDGDQSHRRVYTALLPKIGLLYDLRPGTQLYANASRSYEPPLLLELNSLTVPGFIDLDPQDAWQVEAGTRGRSGRVDWDVSLYDVEIANEILNVNVEPFPGAGFTVPTYRNADRTRHDGLEAALTWRPVEGIQARVAYTFARYRYVADSAYDGNDIPGAPRHAIQADLSWRHASGLSLTPSAEWIPSAYAVTSDNAAENDGWLNLGLRAEWAPARLGLAVFAAVQNLTDARYAGTVQVDNAAGRFYEPADGRSVYAGLRWHP
jgi:iron complex outermembrane receptor protein